MPSIEHMLTVAQAAKKLGITRRAVASAISRNALKAQKLPGHTGAYLIDSDELDRYDVARRRFDRPADTTETVTAP